MSYISYLSKGFYRPHSLGNIRAEVEGVTELAAEKLTADNEFKLFSERKRRLVTQGKDGLVWKLSLDNW